MFTLLICLTAVKPVDSETGPELLLQTFKAVCWVESGGDPKAYNAREQAAGIVQIRPICVRDCNRIIGYEKWSLADRWDPVKSWQMFRLYVRYYAPQGGPEQWARTWNGGPKGPRRASTLAYWQRVRGRMARQ